MASLIRRLRGNEQRFDLTEFNRLVQAANGYGYTSGSLDGTTAETISSDFTGLVQSVHRNYGIVPACVFARQLVLSQVRFVFRGTRMNATPGKIVGGQGLGRLEHPGAMTRPSLLKKVEAHASYAGNAYFYFGRNTTLLRPDWVSMILGSDLDPDHPGWAEDAHLVGIAYTPGGPANNQTPRVILPPNFAHWAPEPDPEAQFRGESWVLSVLSEIRADKQAASHTDRYFVNAATPNLVVTTDANLTAEQAKELGESLKSKHSGVGNAWKNLVLTAGADAKVIGANLADLSLKDVTGGYEARIVSRSRVPAVVAGTREGGQSSAFNSSFYGAARRLWADGWFSPTVQDLCAALDPVVEKPGRTNDLELWYDAADVMFLQEDQKDAADINAVNATALRQLVDGGFDPTSAVEAVASGDMTKLTHSGNLSVQLLPPGTAGRAVDEVERDEHGRILRVVRGAG